MTVTTDIVNADNINADDITSTTALRSALLAATTVADLTGAGPAQLIGQSANKAASAQTADGVIAAGSLNTSSVTDAGAGANTPNFTNAFADAVYQVTQSASVTTRYPGVSHNGQTALQINTIVLDMYAATPTGTDTFLRENVKCSGALA